MYGADFRSRSGLKSNPDTRYVPSRTIAFVGLISGRVLSSTTGAATAPVTMVMKSCVRPLGILARRQKLVDDAPCCSPYLIPVVLVEVEIVRNIVVRALFGVVYGRISQHPQRHFYHLGHLVCVGLK